MKNKASKPLLKFPFGSCYKNLMNQKVPIYISQNSVFLKWLIYNMLFNQGIFLTVSKRSLNNCGFYMCDYVNIFILLMMLTCFNIVHLLKYMHSYFKLQSLIS